MRLVGERGFEPPTPWSRTWGRGADFVSIQSFEWCFNRLSLAESRQFGRNVDPPTATLARVSFQSPMSYLKDYVEGKLPVYRHSSQNSQEIRFIRFFKMKPSDR